MANEQTNSTTPEETLNATLNGTQQQDNSATGGDNKDKQANPDAKSGEDGKKEYTQAEIDQIVKDRLARANKNKEPDNLEDIVAKKVAEQLKTEKRLSELSDEERAREELELELKNYKEREAEYKAKELLADTKGILVDSDIPAVFAPFLVAEDIEKTKANIDTFKAAFASAVQDASQKSLKGTTPERSKNSDQTMTAAKIRAIVDPNERLDMIMQNPELFNK